MSLEKTSQRRCSDGSKSLEEFYAKWNDLEVHWDITSRIPALHKAIIVVFALAMTILAILAIGNVQWWVYIPWGLGTCICYCVLIWSHDFKRSESKIEFGSYSEGENAAGRVEKSK